MKYSVFIGRFQPLHAGHVALIRRVLDEGKPILVLLRTTGMDADNPYSGIEREGMFQRAFPAEYGDTLQVLELGVDVGEVCYGRGVGYAIRGIRLDERTEAVSATAIREGRA